LEFLQSPSDSWPRNAKFFDQIGFRGNAVAGLVIARLDAISYHLKHLTMLGGDRGG
jgi:hypothetical protein